MFNEMKENFKVTWIFFLARFAASLVVGLIYILLAAAIQYMYVGFLGETKFNYIMGGIFSLMIGSLICTYLGKLAFMFVRGWHMAAMAFAGQIKARNLPPLEAGMTVFSKHFSSFAVVYGAQLLIGKLASKGVEYLWGLLKDVPILCNLERFAKNPIVSKVGKDILDTGFDAAMFYIIKYTKPGLGDDLAAVPKAIKRYLYALPQVMLTSVTGYLLFYFAPRLLKWGTFIYLVWHNGLVAGVLLCALTYPIFYIIQHTFFEPLESMLLISCYSKHCKDEPEDDSIYKSIIDSILSASGFADMFQDEEQEAKESTEPAEDAAPEGEDPTGELNLDVEPDLEDAVVSQPAAAAASLSTLIQEAQEPDVSDMPISDAVPETPPTPPQPSRRPANLTELVDRYATAHAHAEDEEEAPTTGRAAPSTSGLFAQQPPEQSAPPAQPEQPPAPPRPRSAVLSGLGALNAELLGNIAPAMDVETSEPDNYLAGGSDEDFE